MIPIIGELKPPPLLGFEMSDELRGYLEIRPEHVSVYLLEIDEDSRLGKESLAGGSRCPCNGESPHPSRKGPRAPSYAIA